MIDDSDIGQGQRIESEAFIAYNLSTRPFYVVALINIDYVKRYTMLSWKQPTDENEGNLQSLKVELTTCTLISMDKKPRVNNNQKTAIGSGIVYSSAKKDGFNAIVLCPSHLTNKWKREVERLVPKSEAYIIHDLDGLKEIESKILNKNKDKSLFMIMSKETAKFGYDNRPCAIWSETKKCYVCPECGQPLFRIEYIGTGRNREAVKILLRERDMTKQYAFNSFCSNEVQVWNKKEHRYKKQKCNAKLWTALNCDEQTEWVKLGSEGWIIERHMDILFNKLANKEKLNRIDSKFFAKLLNKIEERNEGKLKSSHRAPKKYPLSKYIKKFYKGYMDFFIGDELECWLLA